MDSGDVLRTSAAPHGARTPHTFPPPTTPAPPVDDLGACLADARASVENLRLRAARSSEMLNETLSHSSRGTSGGTKNAGTLAGSSAPAGNAPARNRALSSSRNELNLDALTKERDELLALLHERDKDLAIAAEIGGQLLEANMVLKSAYETLLAGAPAADYSSQPGSTGSSLESLAQPNNRSSPSTPLKPLDSGILQSPGPNSVSRSVHAHEDDATSRDSGPPPPMTPTNTARLHSNPSSVSKRHDSTAGYVALLERTNADLQGQLSAALERLRETSATYSRQLTSADVEIAQLRAELERNEQEKLELHREKQQLTRERQALRREVTAKAKAIAGAPETVVEALETRIAQLENANEGLVRKNDELTQQLDAIVREVSREHADQLAVSSLAEELDEKSVILKQQDVYILQLKEKLDEQHLVIQHLLSSNPTSPLVSTLAFDVSDIVAASPTPIDASNIGVDRCRTVDVDVPALLDAMSNGDSTGIRPNIANFAATPIVTKFGNSNNQTGTHEESSPQTYESTIESCNAARADAQVVHAATPDLKSTKSSWARRRQLSFGGNPNDRDEITSDNTFARLPHELLKENALVENGATTFVGKSLASELTLAEQNSPQEPVAMNTASGSLDLDNPFAPSKITDSAVPTHCVPVLNSEGDTTSTTASATASTATDFAYSTRNNLSKSSDNLHSTNPSYHTPSGGASFSNLSGTKQSFHNSFAVSATSTSASAVTSSASAPATSTFASAKSASAPVTFTHASETSASATIASTSASAMPATPAVAVAVAAPASSSSSTASTVMLSTSAHALHSSSLAAVPPALNSGRAVPSTKRANSLRQLLKATSTSRLASDSSTVGRAAAPIINVASRSTGDLSHSSLPLETRDTRMNSKDEEPSHTTSSEKSLLGSLGDVTTAIARKKSLHDEKLPMVSSLTPTSFIESPILRQSHSSPSLYTYPDGRATSRIASTTLSVFSQETHHEPPLSAQNTQRVSLNARGVLPMQEKFATTRTANSNQYLRSLKSLSSSSGTNDQPSSWPSDRTGYATGSARSNDALWERGNRCMAPAFVTTGNDEKETTAFQSSTFQPFRLTHNAVKSSERTPTGSVSDLASSRSLARNMQHVPSATDLTIQALEIAAMEALGGDRYISRLRMSLASGAPELPPRKRSWTIDAHSLQSLQNVSASMSRLAHAFDTTPSEHDAPGLQLHKSDMSNLVPGGKIGKRGRPGRRTSRETPDLLDPDANVCRDVRYVETQTENVDIHFLTAVKSHTEHNTVVFRQTQAQWVSIGTQTSMAEPVEMEAQTSPLRLPMTETQISGIKMNAIGSQTSQSKIEITTIGSQTSDAQFTHFGVQTSTPQFATIQSQTSNAQLTDFGVQTSTPQFATIQSQTSTTQLTDFGVQTAEPQVINTAAQASQIELVNVASQMSSSQLVATGTQTSECRLQWQETLRCSSLFDVPAETLDVKSCVSEVDEVTSRLQLAPSLNAKNVDTKLLPSAEAVRKDSEQSLFSDQSCDFIYVPHREPSSQSLEAPTVTTSVDNQRKGLDTEDKANSADTADAAHAATTANLPKFSKTNSSQLHFLPLYSVANTTPSLIDVIAADTLYQFKRSRSMSAPTHADASSLYSHFPLAEQLHTFDDGDLRAAVDRHLVHRHVALAPQNMCASSIESLFAADGSADVAFVEAVMRKRMDQLNGQQTGPHSAYEGVNDVAASARYVYQPRIPARPLTRNRSAARSLGASGEFDDPASAHDSDDDNDEYRIPPTNSALVVKTLVDNWLRFLYGLVPLPGVAREYAQRVYARRLTRSIDSEQRAGVIDELREKGLNDLADEMEEELQQHTLKQRESVDDITVEKKIDGVSVGETERVRPRRLEKQSSSSSMILDPLRKVLVSVGIVSSSESQTSLDNGECCS